MNLHNLTIKETHKLLEEKELTSVELVRSHFNEIQNKDNDIYAFLSVTEEAAIEQAKKVDERIEKVEPMTGGTALESVVRKDDDSKDIATDKMKADILNAAPDKENDYFKVPSILK